MWTVVQKLTKCRQQTSRLLRILSKANVWGRLLLLVRSLTAIVLSDDGRNICTDHSDKHLQEVEKCC